MTFELFFIRLLDACKNPLERTTLRNLQEQMKEEYIEQVKETY